MADQDIPTTTNLQKVRVFIDFWNFQLSWQRYTAKNSHYRVDWNILPLWLANNAGSLALGSPDSRIQFEGAHVYLSYNAKTPQGRKLHHWAHRRLQRVPGLQLIAKERRPKNPPVCQKCHKSIKECPHCGEKLAGTVEKGIDTAIVTDMIKLAWEDSYQIGVLVSADRDFIPAVEFLHDKGKKIVHAGFPPEGTSLANACWSSLNLTAKIDEFRRH